jgi:hypothetical protein
VSGRNPARGYSAWPGGLPRAAGQNSREAAARPNEENGMHGPRQRTRDGAVARSSAAQRWLAGGKVYPGSTRGVPGWRQAGHDRRGRTEAAARRRGGEAAQDSVFNGGGVAPVALDECGGVLQLEEDQWRGGGG